MNNIGTNLEGEFPNDGNSKGLKFETSALAYTAVQLKSMKDGDRVAIAATSTYMGRDVVTPGTFAGTDAGLKIDLFGPQLVSRGAGGDVVIASENGKAYIGTMDVNGDIEAADTNGLKIDGDGSNLNVKSIGGNVEITAATGDVSLTGTKITRSGVSTEFDSP